MSEYVGGYAQRLAWLTGFGGSAGTRGGAARTRRRSSSTGATPCRCATRSTASCSNTSRRARDQPGRMAQAERAPKARRSAMTRGCIRAAGSRRREGTGEDRRRSSSRSTAIRSTRSGPTSPNLRRAARSSMTTTYAGQFERRKARRSGRLAQARRARRRGHQRARFDRLAAQYPRRDVEHTPVALSYVIAHADGTAELFIAPDKVTPEAAAASRQRGDDPRRGRIRGALGELAGKTVAVDPDFGVAAIFQALETAGATVVAVRDPTSCPRRSRTRSNSRATATRRRATARRWRVPPLARDRSAQGRRSTELTRRGAAAGVPPRDAGPARDLRSTPFPAAGPTPRSPHYRVDEDEQPADPSRAASILVDSGGQYPRRHDRHHPHRVDRARANRAAEMQGPLHPRAQGPHRARRADLPAGHQRQPARHARAAVPVGGGRRLCPRHRPRRRQLPRRARRAAAHRQAARRAGRHRPGTVGRA